MLFRTGRRTTVRCPLDLWRRGQGRGMENPPAVGRPTHSRFNRTRFSCAAATAVGFALLTLVMVPAWAQDESGSADPSEAVQVDPESEQSAEAPSDAEVISLVEQLGDAEFTVRERATQRLIDVGLSAVDALRVGSEHPDREIRYRSRRILATVQDLDFESRLKAFLSSSDGTRDYDLPGWKQYREFAGDDRHVRELFVDMQRSESELLSAIADGKKSTNEALTKRVQAIQQAMQLNRNKAIIDIGTIATLLFAAMNDDVTVPPLASQTISNFLYQPSFNNAIHSGGGRPAVLRRMLAEWIRRRTDAVNVYQSMMLALRYEVKEGLVPAARALRDAARQMNQPSNAHLRQYGLLTFARFGGKEHIALVEPLLQDKTPYGGQRNVNNVRYRTQIRDIALATLVRLAGLEYRDFGFAHLQKHPQYVFNASTLAFADDKERDAAIEKWAAYRKSADGGKTDLKVKKPEVKKPEEDEDRGER